MIKPLLLTALTLSSIISYGQDDLNKFKIIEGDTIYVIVEEHAQPINGMRNFYQSMGQIMKYPKEARRNQAEGTVFLEFIVNIDGTLSDIKVIKGIGYGCDEEAVRALKAGGKWSPGKIKKRIVRSRFNLALIFKLS